MIPGTGTSIVSCGVYYCGEAAVLVVVRVEHWGLVTEAYMQHIWAVQAWTLSINI